jgi:hypothetical protein
MKKRVLVPAALRPPRVPGKRGAPFGNHNAFKHGKFTRQRRALYADIREHIRRGRALIKALARPPTEKSLRDFSAPPQSAFAKASADWATSPAKPWRSRAQGGSEELCDPPSKGGWQFRSSFQFGLRLAKFTP